MSSSRWRPTSPAQSPAGHPGYCWNTQHPASTGNRATPPRPAVRWPATPSSTSPAAPRVPCSSSGGSHDAAMLWDWHSWWAQQLPFRPSEDLDARERAEAFYEVLYDRHLTVDFAHPETDLSAHRLVVVPALYLMTE